jgi:hypothetical protein
VLLLTGAVLVLLTWAVCLGAMMLIGLPIAALSSSGPLRASDARRGMWWGLLVVTLVAYLVNLRWPLASGPSTTVMLAVVGLGVLGSVLLLRRRGWRRVLRWRVSVAVLAVGLGAALAYLAVASLGSVTNYDSGLYHLGAIRYAAEYPAIPGIANLYFPFGYANAAFPLGALLENGPWGADGFRLLNGLIIAAVVIDLIERALSRRWTAGFFVLLVGTSVLLAPMILLADYWVASPSQDTAVFAVTVAASAVIADAVAGGRRWVADAAVASAMGLLMVLLRPTMGAFLVTVLLVAIALRWRRGGVASLEFGRSAIMVAIAAVVAAIAATLRDVVLSGWLQYPLSLLAFDVPWRAPDPVNDRLATLGFHRDPTDLWDAAHGYGWIVAWLGRLPYQWESYLVLLLGAAALMSLVGADRIGTLRWRGMLGAMAPSIAAAVVWFVATPPAFRFAWGLIFSCFTIPIGWGIWRRRIARRHYTTSGCDVMVASIVSGVLVGTTLVAGVFRLDHATISDERTWVLGIRVPYAVTALPLVDTTSGVLPGGVTIQMPLNGEQCWAAFPVCTPRNPSSLRSRSDQVTDGFVS